MADRPRNASMSPARATRQGARRSGANHADLQVAVPTRLATARQVRKRFMSWVLRIGGRALALADRTRCGHVACARRAKGHGEAEPTTDLQTAMPTASAKTAYDQGPTSWRPRAGLGRSSNKCEHVAGARRAKGHGGAEPTVQTCRPQCPRALQPHGKCGNGLRSGSYILAAARWTWQIVQEL